MFQTLILHLLAAKVLSGDEGTESRMQLNLPGLHEEALAWTRPIVSGVRPDQWDLPTPCDPWDVRTLANHVVAGNWWVAPLVEGGTIAGVGDRYDGDVLNGDPAKAYEQSANSAIEAFYMKDAMSLPCAVSYGPVPGAVYCGHRIIDVVVHGWDLATATGQATAIPPHLLGAVREIIEPQAEDFRAAGVFGPRVKVAKNASAQQSLLALVGRTEQSLGS